MVKKKGKSKRVSLHQKYKIQKKVREHNRKQRKLSKKAIKKNGNRKKKTDNPGIPNAWPYKEDLLKEIETAKKVQDEKAEAEKKRKKKERLLRRKDFKEEKRREQQRAQDALTANYSTAQIMQMELKKSITEAEVVAIVLDARDPLGSRPISLENGLLVHAKKKVLLVLNKMDLIPRDLGEKWLRYLNRIHPTVGVYAADGKPRFEPTIGKKRKPVPPTADQILKEKLKSIQSKIHTGNTDPLRELLKSLVSPETSTLNVALIGYPNVGKSSVANSLKKGDTCLVAPKAGSTLKAEKLDIGGHVTIIDCPPIPVDFIEDYNAIMRCGIADDYAFESVNAIDGVLERCDRTNLMIAFKLPRFGNAEEFLAQMAKKRGRLLQGGTPDLVGTARMIFREWGLGRANFAVDVPSSAPTRFEPPQWYQDLDKKTVEERQLGVLDCKRFVSHDNLLLIKPIARSNLKVSLEEYEAVMEGKMPEPIKKNKEQLDSEDGEEESDSEEVSEGEEDDGDEQISGEEDEEEEGEDSEEEEEEEEEESEEEVKKPVRPTKRARNRK